MDNISVLVYNISSNSNRSTTTPPAGLTSVELWIQLIFFYIFLNGVVTNIIGTAIWVGIVRKKDLRTRFFIMIGFITFCRSCYCTNMFFVGIYRSLFTAGVIGTSQRRIVCHLINFWCINAFVLEQVLLLALVTDRFIALMAINYYRLMRDRSAAYVCVSLYIFVTIIVMGPPYFVDNMFEYAPCTNGDSFLNPYLGVYKTNLSLAIVCTIFVLNCVLMFYLRMQAKAMVAVAHESEVAKAALQRQMKLMPMFRNIILMHCGFTFTSKILNVISTLVPPAYGQRLNMVGGILTVLDMFLNNISIVMTNADIRSVVMPWRQNQVMSL